MQWFSAPTNSLVLHMARYKFYLLTYVYNTAVSNRQHTTQHKQITAVVGSVQVMEIFFKQDSSI
jgi:hypothetical protein